MPPEGGAEVGRVVKGTDEPFVCTDVRRVGRVLGESLTKEQASRVL